MSRTVDTASSGDGEDGHNFYGDMTSEVLTLHERRQPGLHPLKGGSSEASLISSLSFFMCRRSASCLAPIHKISGAGDKVTLSFPQECHFTNSMYTRREAPPPMKTNTNHHTPLTSRVPCTIPCYLCSAYKLL